MIWFKYRQGTSGKEIKRNSAEHVSLFLTMYGYIKDGRLPGISECLNCLDIRMVCLNI